MNVLRFLSMAVLVLSVFAACGEDPEVIVIPENALYKETAYIFDDTKVHEIQIGISGQAFTNVVLGNYPSSGSEAYALATNCTFDGEAVADIGMRSRGGTSSANLKRQFKLAFDCDTAYTDASIGATVSMPSNGSRRFHGLKKLNLRASQNDPTMIREKIASYLHQAAGIPAPRVGFAKVYVNGEYWGLYLVTEQIDKTFLETRYAEKSGNLYKAVNAAARFAPGNEAGFELKTNELTDPSKGDLTALFTALAAINTNDAAATKTALEGLFDIDNVLDYMVSTGLVGHWDSLIGISNNDYVYRHSDGKFRLVIWDCDNTFGVHWVIASALNANIYNLYGTDNWGNLFSKVLSVPAFRDSYKAKLNAMLAGKYNRAHMDARIEGWKTLIADAVAADTKKNLDWNLSVANGNLAWSSSFTGHPSPWVNSGYMYTSGVENFIGDRHDIVQAQLSGIAPVDADGNSSFATAATMTADSQIAAGIGGANDKDYYVFTLAPGRYEIGIFALGGNLSLSLYDSSRALLQAANRTGWPFDPYIPEMPEGIAIDVATTTTYYASVQGVGDVASPYQIRLTNMAADGNDTRATAAGLTLNSSVSGTIAGITDIDYLKLTVATAGSYKITLAGLSQTCLFQILDSSGNALDAWGTPNPVTSYQDLSIGTYYLYLDTISGQPTPYTMSFSNVPATAQSVALSIVYTNAGVGGINSGNYTKVGLTGNSTWISSPVWNQAAAKIPDAYDAANNGTLTFTFTVPAGSPAVTRCKVVVRASSDYTAFGTSNGWQAGGDNNIYLPEDAPTASSTYRFPGFE